MTRFLAIDVGAGTLDAMVFDTRSGDQFKCVVKSPTRKLAEKIMACQNDSIIITGRQMGGGPVAQAIREKARESQIIMSRHASETIHHRLERVLDLGVLVVPQHIARKQARGREPSRFRSGDIIATDILNMMAWMGIEPIVDFLGIGVQDHGTPRKQISSLDFRHQIFKEIIDQTPRASAFLFESKEIPPSLRRMRAAAMDAKRIPSDKIYLMDTGMAAILGASSDPMARGRECIIVLDIATSHTLGALLFGEEIGGFFEYHTHALTPEKLRSLIVDLAEGRLSHEAVIVEGGHGAYVRKAAGFNRVELILATGPKRGMLEDMGMDHIVLGAPFGDNMMTGTAGLIIAMAEREGVSLGRGSMGTRAV